MSATVTVFPSSVLQWKPYAEQAGHAWGIPTNVLLALIDEETGGNPQETSATGAKGLTQFEPATARSYQVNTAPGGEYSQIVGAAHYLHDLGYATNPQKALASYNAGPANWQAGLGYANSVLTKARTAGGSTQGSAPAPTAPNPATAAGANPLIPSGRGSGKALEWLLYAVLFLLGAGLTYTGISHATRAAGSHE
jgi:soluble lytic murein transglycosylase-like protein